MALAVAVTAIGLLSRPRYKNIEGWDAAQNKFVREFLYDTRALPGRRVAVLDIDGTMIGQVPYYLADEAMLSYAAENEMSDVRRAVIDHMLATDDTASDTYTRNRLVFLAGMTPDEQSEMGARVWAEKYGAKKVYPEIRETVRNLKRFGYEIYGITCSPEFLYRDVVMEYFGIPAENIVGARGTVENGIMTDRAVEPFPCHAGKAEYIRTHIKTAPLIAVGNSGGDSAMLATSKGIKIWVNSDEKLAEECGRDKKCIVTYSHDIDTGADYTARKTKLKQNKASPKND